MNKRLFLFWGVLVAMVVVVGGGYLIWNKYFKYDPVKVYQEAERKYIEAMTADTYGGKTPQETLDMFVDALRKEDIELASKYFLLDENLSREKWVDALTELRNKNLLGQMVQLLMRATPDPEDSLNTDDFKYVLLNDDGMAEATIDFEFNDRSQVWKIESL